MKILIVADPIAALKPKGDTGLSLLREALGRGHAVYWATGEDLELDLGKLYVNAIQALSCAAAELPQMKVTSERVLVNSFDTVWIRKDPPFDMSYVSLCWLLALEEQNVLILNKPSLLLRYHEKLLPFEAFRQGFIDETDLVPTYVSAGSNYENIPKSFTGEVVSKPWLGFGGNDVERWKSVRDYSLQVASAARKNLLLQPYLENITKTGDRRVIFIGGDFVVDFVRLPREGTFVANLAQGGSAELRELTKKEKVLIDKVSSFLKHIGIFVAGVDIVDECLSEINVTAPTGFEMAHQLRSINPAVRYLDLVEKWLGAKKPFGFSIL